MDLHQGGCGQCCLRRGNAGSFWAALSFSIEENISGALKGLHLGEGLDALIYFLESS